MKYIQQCIVSLSVVFVRCFVEVKQNSTIVVDIVPLFRAASTQIRLLQICHMLCVVYSQRECSF